MQQYGKQVLGFMGLVVILCLGIQQKVLAEATLSDISFSQLPGDKVQLTMKLSEGVTAPEAFTTNNPANISIDFRGVANGVSNRSQSIGIGAVKNVTAIEAGGRTRVVVKLTSMVPYDLTTEGNDVILTLGSVASSKVSSTSNLVTSGARGLSNIDFRRGEGGEGRVVVTLSDPSTVVDIKERNGNVVVMFMNTELPNELSRRLDVTDFSTPVTIVDAISDGRNAMLKISAVGEYEHIAYQADDTFIIEFKAMTKEEQEAIKKSKFKYTGERLSLNFQEIEVRAVLQLLAEFTNLNMVTSDTVGGSLTLRLNNVPWDQALDLILKTKGLSMRKDGMVILVAPTEELASREKLELEATKQIEELAPLRSQLVQVNYAKAEDLAELLKSAENRLLSPRGQVTVDERTNTLLIQDTAIKLDEIRELITKLDIPVKQVLIEARIVIADDDFAKDLGVRFGLSGTNAKPNDTGNENRFVVGGGVSDNGVAFKSNPQRAIGGFNDPTDTDASDGQDIVPLIGDSSKAETLLFNLPAGSATSGVNLLFGKLNSHLLRLELTAMQSEGRGQIVSSPKIITSDQKEAIIKSGTQIPYQEASSSGATTTSFKDAVLELSVKPHITPDDRIVMELKIHKDAVGDIVGNIPSIDTDQLTTEVLVDNGETVVLGGVYTQEKRVKKTKVPFFGDLPYIGALFRQEQNTKTNKELLIFVTPRILKDNLGLN
ncbi:MAG: type IV pilus secretin PilQ [Methylococcales bacterium]|nr:type IV pilus secretin PilQ [Methylococcales bacterium]MBT7410978.1 type IV pilus secretin PilQ [Methylococcales bacterium]